MTMLSAFDTAASALSAESLRLNVTASNMANAQSVAGSAAEVYRAKQPVFAAVAKDAFSQWDLNAQAVSGVKVVGVTESTDPVSREYRPTHPLADEEGYVTLSNVNPIEEMANMISASRSYQWNVDVVNTIKQLSLRTLQLGRD